MRKVVRQRLELMADPLYFVCARETSLPGGKSVPPGLVLIKTPVGSVITAFASRELGEAVLRFRRQEGALFLVSEPQLSPELVGSLTAKRVFVYRTPADYDAVEANPHTFPWADRIVTYDFAAAIARGAV
jgi:hypothetical protein